MGGNIIRPNSACELFEKLAVKTDHDLCDGNALGSPIGEESITDYLALDILRARLPDVSIRKVTKREEAVWGCDFLMQISARASSKKLYWTYAIQAKKLYPNGCYEKIWHAARDEWQGRKLSGSAKRHGYIPLYCFYNFTRETAAKIPSCCLAPQNQSGISVAPIDFIGELHARATNPSYEDVNSSPRVRPLRCLTCCSQVRDATPGQHPMASGEFTEGACPQAAFFDVLQTDVPALLPLELSMRLAMDANEGEDRPSQLAFPRYLITIT